MKRKKSAPKSLRAAKKPGDKRGTNPKSLANLEAHKFPKGTSGNPGGRSGLLSEAYREWLQEIDPETGETNATAVARSIGRQAKAGAVNAAHEIKSATEGDRIEQLNLDVSQLNDEQLARLADGDDIRSIIATSSASRTGTPPANQSAPGDTGT